MEEANDGQGTIDEIMLHDEEEDDDMEGHVFMAIDRFSNGTMILLNVLLGISLVACFLGLLVQCPPIFKRLSQEFTENETLSIEFEMTNLSGWNRFVVISGTVNRTSESLNQGTIDSRATVKVCYDCEGRNPTMTKLSNQIKHFSFKEGSTKSSEKHFVTDVNKLHKQQTYTIEFDDNSEPLTGVDIKTISLDSNHFRVYVIASFVSLLFMGLTYVFYKMDTKDVMPPECTMVTVCVLLAILSSECWQYFIPASHPKWVLYISRSLAACLLWAQRFTLYSLSKCRNVMDSSGIGSLEISLGACAALMDTIKAILEVSYYFKSPYGPGDLAIMLFRIISILTTLIWTLFVARKGKRSGTFWCFFGLIWLSYVVGLIVDGMFGLFKETFFGLYAVFAPAVITIFLLIVTWPVVAHAERTTATEHPSNNNVYQ